MADVPASRRRIVLLRGINLGSRRRVGMADLRKLLDGHGYEDVRTHLQSGNVPADQRRLSRPSPDTARARAHGRARLRRRGGRVHARRARRRHRPRPARRRCERSLALSRYLPRREARSEAPARPGRRAGAGRRERREVYSWHPQGIQSSPLAKLLSKTGVSAAGTNRNWPTVTKLLELADEGAP
ncbi:MAG: hypothetical protein QOF45_433 [Gaiellaceae bacterium]|nr:hypothetical protein [Gaiellaceae bacterium]